VVILGCSKTILSREHPLNTFGVVATMKWLEWKDAEVAASQLYALQQVQIDSFTCGHILVKRHGNQSIDHILNNTRSRDLPPQKTRTWVHHVQISFLETSRRLTPPSLIDKNYIWSIISWKSMHQHIYLTILGKYMCVAMEQKHIHRKCFRAQIFINWLKVAKIRIWYIPTMT
jgi:hypothetical protein